MTNNNVKEANQFRIPNVQTFTALFIQVAKIQSIYPRDLRWHDEIGGIFWASIYSRIPIAWTDTKLKAVLDHSVRQRSVDVPGGAAVRLKVELITARNAEPEKYPLELRLDSLEAIAPPNPSILKLVIQNIPNMTEEMCGTPSCWKKNLYDHDHNLSRITLKSISHAIHNCVNYSALLTSRGNISLVVREAAHGVTTAQALVVSLLSL
ncbi:hypothetical protein J6590_029916 [Homalodisca vitripennis]|nr:hypothetical protein J6590_029916 [Homalodisca vitripennis]